MWLLVGQIYPNGPLCCGLPPLTAAGHHLGQAHNPQLEKRSSLKGLSYEIQNRLIVRLKTCDCQNLHLGGRLPLTAAGHHLGQAHNPQLEKRPSLKGLSYEIQNRVIIVRLKTCDCQNLHLGGRLPLTAAGHHLGQVHNPQLKKRVILKGNVVRDSESPYSTTEDM